MAKKSQTTPKKKEKRGSEQVIDLLRASGLVVKEDPADDSVKVRVPFPRKK